MPIGKVENVSPTKSGKAFRVRVAGNYYNAFLDSGIDKVVGQTIDFQVTPDKGYGLGIGQWGPTQAAPTVPPVIHNIPASQAPNRPTGALERLTEPELRFVSNCVGQAITAKSIISPDEIGVWTKAAAAAVREV